MSKTRKILDQYFFAPDRYLDYDGDILHAGAVKKFISRPAVKASSLVSVALAVTFAAANDKNFAATILAVTMGSLGGITFSRSLRKDKTPIFMIHVPIKKRHCTLI